MSGPQNKGGHFCVQNGQNNSGPWRAPPISEVESQKPEVKSQKSEVISQKSEVKSRKSEARAPKSEAPAAGGGCHSCSKKRGSF